MDYPRLADKRAYVAAVIQEIFEKDIRRRVKIKNVSVFNQVRDYVINNFRRHHVACEHPIRPREQAGREDKRETLARYLQILEDAKIVSKCARFDLKSRKSLRVSKSTIWRTWASTSPSTPTTASTTGPCWRTSSTATLAQGCKVSVGRIGKLECDFILRTPEMGYAYIQEAMTIMADRSTEEREYRPFTQIRTTIPSTC